MCHDPTTQNSANEVVPCHHHLLSSNLRHLHPTAAHHHQSWMPTTTTAFSHHNSIFISIVQYHSSHVHEQRSSWHHRTSTHLRREQPLRIEPDSVTSRSDITDFK